MKLFVGSLPYTLNDEKLKELFLQIGEVVEAKVIIDRETGRSRGFGFVTMKNPNDAKKAIDQLNGSNVGERSIVVKKANDEGRR